MDRNGGVILVMLGLALIGGCGAELPDVDTGTAGVAAPQEDAVCLQGQPFVANGEIAVQGGATADAEAIRALRWERHSGCERFVIDLGRGDGEPAGGAGEVSARLLRDLGVVRVSLRAVERVSPEGADASFAGPLARAAYTVWSDEGNWVYVDVHLGEPAEAHVSLLGDPARIVVDLRPGGGALPAPPATHGRVVVLEPRPGAATYPLTVTGYSRTFEANIVARIEQAGQEILETFTTATGWVDAWGHYSLTIEEGPNGPIQLHVGEYSARDGTWEGVVVELDQR